MTKNRRRRKPNKRKFPAPRTEKEFRAMSARSQDEWTHITHVISRMRDQVSLRRASREFGIDPRIVARRARSALRKRSNGRYVARASDRLLRVLSVLTPKGRREIAVRDSRQASRLGSYWAAVQRYLQSGDDSALREFRGKKITDASRKHHPLITDLNQLNLLGSAGVLSFESLYAGVR